MATFEFSDDDIEQLTDALRWGANTAAEHAERRRQNPVVIAAWQERVKKFRALLDRIGGPDVRAHR